MSKVIKQMEMDALKKDLAGVRDLVLLSVQGVSSQTESGFRASLRKKKIRVRMVKNTLTRRVFGEMGLNVPADSPFWKGPTALVWGGGSIGELTREIEAELTKPKTAAQYKDKVKKKGALADGQPVTYEQALKMPTRAEAIARVIGLALAPASRLVAQLTSPAGRVAGQIKSIAEKKPEEAAAAPPA